MLSLNEKMSEVQHLHLRATFHALPLFYCERKFYARTHVRTLKLRDTGNQPLGLFAITFMLQIKKRAGVGGGGHSL